MGSSNETSYFGPVRNPWDTARVPGGSSGGSAAAVAARMAPAATGTDTGGSIRQPAALTGRLRAEADLRPGVALRHDRLRLLARPGRADGQERRGPARCCSTSMAGFDARDSTSLERPRGGLRARAERSRSRACASACRRSISARASTPDVRAARARGDRAGSSRRARSTSRSTLPNTGLAVPVYYVIAPAEASSNLSRFDGVRYGHRAQDYADLPTCTARRAPRASAPR